MQRSFSLFRNPPGKDVQRMGSSKGGIVNLKEIKKIMKKMQTAPEKVVEVTVKDFKSRAPGWVASEVAKHYNVKRSDIAPAKYTKSPIGKVKVKGKTLDTVNLIYKGRVLTPVRFKMSPTEPTGGAYTLKATVVKGQRKTLGKVKKLTKKQKANIGKNFTQQGTRNSNKSPIMLMGTGNKKVDGTNYIPFQRQSKDRKDIKAIKTLSMPQMVSNPQVEEQIYKTISEKLGKRLDHHVDRYMGK